MSRLFMPFALLNAIASLHAAFIEEYDRAAWLAAMACYSLLFDMRDEIRKKRGAS